MKVSRPSRSASRTPQSMSWRAAPRRRCSGWTKSIAKTGGIGWISFYIIVVVEAFKNRWTGLKNRRALYASAALPFSAFADAANHRAAYLRILAPRLEHSTKDISSPIHIQTPRPSSPTTLSSPPHQTTFSPTFRPPHRLLRMLPSPPPIFHHVRILQKDIPLGRSYHLIPNLRIHNLEPPRCLILPEFPNLSIPQLNEASAGLVVPEESKEWVEGRAVGFAFALDDLVEFYVVGDGENSEGHG